LRTGSFPSSSAEPIPDFVACLKILTACAVIGTRNVPVWILARDPGETFSRASEIPDQLMGCWDWD